MKYAVFWTNTALSDLKAIHGYLLEVTDRATATRLIKDIRQATRLLPEQPRMYAIFPESAAQVRHITVHAWRLLYIVDDAQRTCRVLSVTHAARQFP
ncbi:hypothetical protein CO615_02890 [Lysobacteraceae bacterium NML75-0749]|nr:hypothetical protein CO615_02890 [Xanthomonadaceae bacterium NML75-0749]PJK02675.1 hypothetical protein CO609_09390 [Xanthomonadaceae bacterium NML91-0268]